MNGRIVFVSACQVFFSIPLEGVLMFLRNIVFIAKKHENNG